MSEHRLDCRCERCPVVKRGPDGMCPACHRPIDVHRLSSVLTRPLRDWEARCQIVMKG